MTGSLEYSLPAYSLGLTYGDREESWLALQTCLDCRLKYFMASKSAHVVPIAYLLSECQELGILDEASAIKLRQCMRIPSWFFQISGGPIVNLKLLGQPGVSKIARESRYATRLDASSRI
eukprot:4559417-Karenia_brevis.AAC.1